MKATYYSAGTTGAVSDGNPHSALEWRQFVHGQKPGDYYVKIGTHRGFKRIQPGYVAPSPDTNEPQRSLGRALYRVRLVLFGKPIPTALEARERLTKTKALAIFSSDALSSVAYATEEIMKVLVLGGLALLSLALPISLVIVTLLAVVVLSYRQTIKAYPSGGGSYIVASQNLGKLPGLTAAAALLIDYVLTVSVSVAAGVAAITSLFPALLPDTIALTIVSVAVVALVNLRGVRESGSIFAVPTYLFVGTMFVLLAYGMFRLLAGGMVYAPPPSVIQPGVQPLSIFLLLSAFAQGCTAMTGTEAISNGVPAFEKPESENARATMTMMGLLLGTMFLGLSFLATRIGVHPAETETVLSQIARTVFGAGPLWYLLQIATALILILAANTSFADFPRLSSILARDRYLPRTFQFRGDRLAFNVGIIALALLSVLLLVLFQGSVARLIPLYAIGVFTSFTLSQAGMVVHWRRERSRGWQRSAVINGVGAVATGIVSLVIAGSKFTHGAWLVVLLIPLLIGLMRAIHTHYKRLETAREAETSLSPEQVRVYAVVPVADLGVEAQQALAFAKAITREGSKVVAVHVSDSQEDAERFRSEWGQWNHSNAGVDLLVIDSPYRSLIRPLLACVDALKESHPHDTVTVVLPEFVPSTWWEQLLHNHTALRIKGALLFRPGIVVVNVPYHLAKPKRQTPNVQRTKMTR